MDTKLKDIKYALGIKIIAVIILWLSIMGSLGSGIFLLYNGEKIRSKSYFETNDFKYEFARLADNVLELKLRLKDENHIRASAQSEDEIREGLNRLSYLKTELAQTVNFAYYLKNTQTGETFTNVTSGDPAAVIKKQPSFVYLGKQNTYSTYPLDPDLKQMLTDTPYEYYAAVIEPLKEGDAFYEDLTSYSRMKDFLPYALPLLIGSLILLVFTFSYLVGVAGRREKGGEIALTFVDKIYSDVLTLLVLFAAACSLDMMNGLNFGDFYGSLILVTVLFGIDLLIGLTYFLSLVRQYKKGIIFKNTLIYHLFVYLVRFSTLCFQGKIFKAWTLGLLLAYGAINGILFLIAGFLNNDTVGVLFTGFIIIAFNLAAIYFTAQALRSLTQIMEAAKETSTGNLDYPLDQSKVSVAFSSFAEDIQSIQGGLKNAVAEAIKGERMKTDLITNVSHDLKTPLTSIMNYVDLLKKEELNNEKAAEYLTILEEKSQRLKQLIEDLTEASKASSGNLAITVEKVDLQELVLQACGEYEEKINQAELEIRMSAGEKKTFVRADGKCMWRIVENLLSNVVKYSMPHSRVYLHIDQNPSYGLLTVKNISSYPLDIPPEQLTERFVRGDASRSTEGSGLGLSIAQSLATIQGGKFNIDIDGDLFKVTVEIPLWIES
ncbi:sensor histidine kinase [Candidatus Formimonas warabiya]|uniref:histidine kinase n=1 Tax=Formimonas warabiya TaxID=1761012 RepID=A0A3G1KLW6_FORW1|nr:HAMP domain-containing sensor histidine kinase [Candidatus Formimonas warabiya]ATW23414.1 two-component sensor histidine kinase [Candidatus Formimonas warabiya]